MVARWRPRRLLRGVAWRLKRTRLPRLARLEDLPERIPPGVAAVSFDCFDTLIRRRSGSPRNVLTRWSELLADRCHRAGLRCSAAELLAQREASEASLRAASSRDHETTLVAIHGRLAELAGLPPSLAAEALDLEMNCEREVLEPMPGAGPALARLRSLGLRIAVVSDMYWEQAHLAALLDALGLARHLDLLLLSSSEGATKTSGRLFEVLCRRLDLEPSRILHVGDNPWSDAFQPRAHGLRAYWFDSPSERARRAAIQGTAGGRAADAGRTVGGASHPAFEIGRDVIGPLLGVFVHQTLTSIERSRWDGRRHLLCWIARDGWLPMQIAEVFAEEDPRFREVVTAMPRRYLHLSRLACLPAAGGDPMTTATGLATSLGPGACPRAVARLLGLADVDLEGLPPDFLDDSEVPGDGSEWASRLLQDARVAAVLPGRRRHAREALAGYLHQEGLLGDSGITAHLIDLGWRSTIQLAITRAFAGIPDRADLVGHLLGNLRPERHLDEEGRSRLEPGIAIDALRPDPLDRAIRRAISLCEVACQESAGSVLGYTCGDGRWEPVLGPLPEVPREFASEMRAGVIERARRIAHDARLGVVSPRDLLGRSRRELARFVLHPTRAEALAFTGVYFDPDSGTGRRMPCVAPLLGAALWLRPNQQLGRIRGAVWVEGSLRASALPGHSVAQRAWLILRRLRGSPS